jgi:hypothetical protein
VKMDVAWVVLGVGAMDGRDVHPAFGVQPGAEALHDRAMLAGVETVRQFDDEAGLDPPGTPLLDLGQRRGIGPEGGIGPDEARICFGKIDIGDLHRPVPVFAPGPVRPGLVGDPCPLQEQGNLVHPLRRVRCGGQPGPRILMLGRHATRLAAATSSLTTYPQRRRSTAARHSR